MISGNEKILNAALGDYADYGFNLKQDGDHFLLLFFKDKQIAVYNQARVTIPILHEGCRNYLASFTRMED